MVKRKTREQKKIAELRRKLSVQTVQTQINTNDLNSPKESKKFFYKLPTDSPVKTIQTNTYQFLGNDLRKTFLLSSAIVAMQIICFMLLKFNFIRISFLKY